MYLGVLMLVNNILKGKMKMAERYISADKFIEWLDVGHLRSPSEICYCEGDVKTMIDMQPTVDVVPRAEVAREIVTELERYLRLNEDIAKKCKEENGEQNREYFKGKLSAFLQIRGYIDAELKKKYTQEK